MGARILLALLWLFQWLPLSVQAAIGWHLGGFLHGFASSRRRSATVHALSP